MPFLSSDDLAAIQFYHTLNLSSTESLQEAIQFYHTMNLSTTTSLQEAIQFYQTMNLTIPLLDDSMIR